ncbi:MAG: hypothetical protein ABIG61_15290 [Planctomycetota bacterium]
MTTILFFDDWPLCSSSNVTRKKGEPKWIAEATLEDADTEGAWNFPCVWYDRQAKLWKALYGAAVRFKPSGAYWEKAQALSYAQSPDGIHWIRPDLKRQTPHLEVRHKPNQVFGLKSHVDGGPVFFDQREPNPNRRLKYFYTASEKLVTAKQGEAIDDWIQWLANSGDGIHWSIDKQPWGTTKFDSPVACFYNDFEKCYCIIARRHCGDRRISIRKTTDFRNVSPPRLIMHPDPEDPPIVQFYGMPVYKYEYVYIGLLWRLHCDPGEISYHKCFGPMDCVLAYSFDGDHFFRATHKPFISRNEPGEHGGGCVYVSTMLVDDDNTIRFYSGGSKAEHFQDQSLTDAALMLHTLRLDGFFYLESNSMIGKIITRCVDFNGPNLKLNAQCPHGCIRVQISAPDGKALPGYTFDDCIPFTGDDLFHSVKWKNGKDVGDVSNIVKQQSEHAEFPYAHIEVELTSGRLYAIRGDFELKVGSGSKEAGLTQPWA